MTLFQGLSWKWYSGKRSFVEMVFRGNAFGEMGFGKKGFGDVAVRPLGYSHSLEATFLFFLCIFKFPAHFSSKMAGESKHNNGSEEEKKKMKVQLFEDSEQNGIALYDETYHLHASQIDEI